jgi:hypothetical protein
MADDESALYWGPSTSEGKVVATDIDRMTFIFRLASITDTEVRVGIFNDVNATASGITDGVWFDFTPVTSANWRTITEASNTQTLNTSSTAVVAATWYKIEMIRLSGGNWEFYLDDVLLFTHSTNLPTVAVIPAFVVVKTTNPNDKQLDADYFSLTTKVLTR